MDRVIGRSARDGRQPLVLVVEDDRAIAETVEWVLEDEGFTVAVAHDYRGVLAFVEHSRPDVVVLDYMLPRVDGSGVAAALRERLPNPPPIVLMSAVGTGFEKREAIGAVAFVRKPFEVDDLVDAVRMALNERTPPVGRAA